LSRITYENACRWYSFDPFAHRARERCTVGALRDEATDHDVAVHSFDRGRFERTRKGVEMGVLEKRATA
jgi:hypothetical protein